MSNPVFQHQLAMYFTALPCPPLPILAYKEGDEEQRGHCSYDLIAHYLMLAMLAGDTKLNERRKAKQEKCVDVLVSALQKTTDVDAAYTHYQRFTADYLCAFADEEVGARFAPMDSVGRHHAVHKVCCEWSAGQDIIQEAKGQVTSLGYRGMGYRGMLMAALDRFHALPGAPTTATPLQEEVCCAV